MAPVTEAPPQQPRTLSRSLRLACGVAVGSVVLLDYVLPRLIPVWPPWYSMKVHFVCSSLAPIFVVMPILYPTSLLRGVRRELRAALLVIMCFAVLWVLRLALAMLFIGVSVR
jgi:hypothetical protein